MGVLELLIRSKVKVRYERGLLRTLQTVPTGERGTELRFTVDICLLAFPCQNNIHPLILLTIPTP